MDNATAHIAGTVLRIFIRAVRTTQGLIAFANRIAGRLLGARRVVQQVQQIVGDPDDRGEEM